MGRRRTWCSRIRRFNYTKKSDGASIANDGLEFEQVIADALALVQVDTAYVCGDVKTARAFLRATSCLGEPKNCIVWVKPIQHRMHRYEPCHELIWFWGDNGSPFYGENVFEAKREIQKFHPTVKPVELWNTAWALTRTRSWCLISSAAAAPLSSPVRKPLAIAA
jgi:hypothetical protein